MTDPRIVSPKEAHRAIDETVTYKVHVTWRELAYTVATEPDRTRAAVVKALRAEARYFRVHLGADGLDPEVRRLESRADAIENGADY